MTQGDVHEEIDVLCNLNVADLEISAPFASTREHVLVFGGITGTIADATRGDVFSKIATDRILKT